ncbi:hypothetical protein JEQ12_007659 [Ovis aries]|uniref:Large ribosomal subunit protein eL36 n=1 Tax=Ovis aries TaxID=9940 RepID=A0A835ZRK6_SHEEP|nr:hypothetical protein JEQ12_007659 [Ovis aries]
MGLSKSRKVTKYVSKLRHNGRHGHLTKHTTFVQNMIWEVGKKRVGTHKSAKRKREELSNAMASMRKAAAKKD